MCISDLCKGRTGWIYEITGQFLEALVIRTTADQCEQNPPYMQEFVEDLVPYRMKSLSEIQIYPNYV